MRLLGWRAHYGVGDTVACTEVDDWRELPAGLPGVVEFMEPPYRRLVDGGDWLWVEDGRWQASDTVWDGWVERPHPDAIRGKALPDEAWEALRQQMLDDRDWPDGGA